MLFLMSLTQTTSMKLTGGLPRGVLNDVTLAYGLTRKYNMRHRSQETAMTYLPRSAADFRDITVENPVLLIYDDLPGSVN